ncbi:FAD-dependent oxidoreductase [Candidatus Paracaedibacter symbiosus]|uniref:FAD-dependent oxidoreductase n=1 Tax=Candidatus Paracaedibacter symbiosus TaxID=244582 RepID=UPI0005097CD4|nr:FAD-dependent oxidoreductase [Candidatus Paracaedibacter symbiosus]
MAGKKYILSANQEPHDTSLRIKPPLAKYNYPLQIGMKYLELLNLGGDLKKLGGNIEIGKDKESRVFIGQDGYYYCLYHCLDKASTYLLFNKYKCAYILDLYQIGQKYLDILTNPKLKLESKISQRTGTPIIPKLEFEIHQEAVNMSNKWFEEAYEKGAISPDKSYKIFISYSQFLLQGLLEARNQQKIMKICQKWKKRSKKEDDEYYYYLMGQIYLKFAERGDYTREDRTEFLRQANQYFKEIKEIEKINPDGFFSIGNHFLAVVSTSWLGTHQALIYANKWFKKALRNQKMTPQQCYQLAKEIFFINKGGKNLLRGKGEAETRKIALAYAMQWYERSYKGGYIDAKKGYKLGRSCLDQIISSGDFNREYPLDMLEWSEKWFERGRGAGRLDDIAHKYLEIVTRGWNIPLQIAMEALRLSDKWFEKAHLEEGFGLITGMSMSEVKFWRAYHMAKKNKLNNIKLREAILEAENKGIAKIMAYRILELSFSTGTTKEQHLIILEEAKSLLKDKIEMSASQLLELASTVGITKEQRLMFLEEAKSLLGESESLSVQIRTDFLEIVLNYLGIAQMEWISHEEGEEAFFQAKKYLETTNSVTSKTAKKIVNSLLKIMQKQWISPAVGKEAFQLSQFYMAKGVIENYYKEEWKCYELLQKYLDIVMMDWVTLEVGKEILFTAEGHLKKINKRDSEQAYSIAQRYLRIARREWVDVETGRNALMNASHFLSCLTKLRTWQAKEIGSSFNLIRNCAWLTPMIRKEVHENGVFWLKKSHENRNKEAAYQLGLLYLNLDMSEAFKFFNLQIRYKFSSLQVAAAYQLGRLCALAYPNTKLATYWFSKAEKWKKEGSEKEKFGEELIRTWLEKAEEEIEYAYVLRLLYKVRHTEPSESLEKKLSNKVLKKAKNYEKGLLHGHLPRPFNIHQPYSCVVIGGGLSGVLSALQLSRLKDKNDNPLFKVTLLERQPYLMSEASAVPARLHLGGEYPLDRTTALDCLYSSLLFWQMIPHGYTNIPAVSYLVHGKTDQQASLQQPNTVQLGTINKEYTAIQRKYEECYYFLTSDPSLVNNPFFGPPNRLFRSLESSELPSKGFCGGIITHERGINPAILGAYLEEELRKAGVEVNCSQPVTKIRSKPYGYKVYVAKDRTYKTSQVINATFDHYLDLDQDAGDTQSHDENLNVFLRGMAAIDISDCEIPKVTFRKGEEKEETAIFWAYG